MGEFKVVGLRGRTGFPSLSGGGGREESGVALLKILTIRGSVPSTGGEENQSCYAVKWGDCCKRASKARNRTSRRPRGEKMPLARHALENKLELSRFGVRESGTSARSSWGRGGSTILHESQLGLRGYGC